MTYYVGEIRMFAGQYAPPYWLSCEGQALKIANYQGLFKYIGTTYGGDGQNIFYLPDLRGRVPIGAGRKPGLSNRRLGEKVGSESVALTTEELPEHEHALRGADVEGDTKEPYLDTSLASTKPGLPAYSPGNARGFTPVEMSSDQISSTGEGGAHQNMSPFLTVNFIIATGGHAPSATS